MLGLERASLAPQHSVPGTATRPRRVLILNWRDVTHPQGGGAERVTHEIARRWVDWGHQVTLFCASYPGAASEDVIDGVRIVRRGRQQTVHWEAYRHYRRGLHGCCDVIIDEVNTIPFFTPLYAREPVIMYSNQLAREVWRYEAPFPLSVLGYAAEPVYMQVYRRTPVLTISRSTEHDLRAMGLGGPFYVIPMSVDTAAPAALPPLQAKEPTLTMIFVGRVVPSKRVHHIVLALKRLHRAGNSAARLWIVGAWDEAYRRRLEGWIRGAGLDEFVTFFGRVDAATKERLLARAHVVVMTSAREGWGLVVTEANALGTPAVVYDVAGLRDSTRDGETGLVCRDGHPAALAEAIARLNAQPDLYVRLRTNAWLDAKGLSWDQTALAAWQAVGRHL